MGNHASCAPYIVSGSGAAKVVHNDGRVTAYTRPVRAGELMAENPRQFVCDAGELKVGHRVPGLTAEEELEGRRLYFLLPMDMLYSVLTDDEMAALSCRASGAGKRGRMLPAVLCMFPSEAAEGQPAGAREEEKEEEFTDSVGRQRSWKPALDTIYEACH
ncbi:hypothetical protein Taro_033162 [Colocasia esculenta]|uniref:Uncharacterized protein n=1 Tax=Colocasia esculenta TaxID=4460 RepID=A0A843W0X4_COLES|nr:hypothetical protein [Colocasia esculenta]